MAQIGANRSKYPTAGHRHWEEPASNERRVVGEQDEQLLGLEHE